MIENVVCEAVKLMLKIQLGYKGGGVKAAGINA